MAQLIIHKDKIKSNIKKLSAYFKEKGIEWSLITKVFSGDKEFLSQILTDDVIEHIGSVGDSRLTSLKNLRAVNPEMRTIYIKPPAATYADDLVRYADVSLNSSYSTIVALNEAAADQGIVHQVIIMIELGELREGINEDDILTFYGRVLELPYIEVIGIGSNLGCMYGVEPTQDKLQQLCAYKGLIIDKFDVDLPLISGGTSITLPLLEQGVVPPELNHFRIGEAAFFGITPLEEMQFLDLHTDTFEFKANIIELEEKQLVPDGVISDANIGHTAEVDENAEGESSYKAILDFGLLDVAQEDLTSIDVPMEFVGITSDMTVVDVGGKLDQNTRAKITVGRELTFTPNYMGVARLLNSKFIDKTFV